MVRQKIQEYFEGTDVKLDFIDSPEESIAVGSAYYAFMKVNPGQTQLHYEPGAYRHAEEKELDQVFERKIIKDPIILGYGGGCEFKRTIFMIGSDSKEAMQYVDDRIDLENCDLVQVRESLYSIFKDERFTQYTINQNEAINTIDIKELPNRQSEGRWLSGITCFSDKFIFLVGGQILGEATNSVTYYDVDEHQWKDAPALNQERLENSSCQHGDFIYTFGGLDSDRIGQTTIERLNVKLYLQG